MHTSLNKKHTQDSRSPSCWMPLAQGCSVAPRSVPFPLRKTHEFNIDSPVPLFVVEPKRILPQWFLNYQILPVKLLLKICKAVTTAVSKPLHRWLVPSTFKGRWRLMACCFGGSDLMQMSPSLSCASWLHHAIQTYMIIVPVDINSARGVRNILLLS